MLMCERLKLETKKDYVIKNKAYCRWMKEDLELMKRYCKRDECPTQQCKEIWRLYTSTYKLINKEGRE